MIYGLVGLNGIVLPETYYSYLGTLAPILSEGGVVFTTNDLFRGAKEVFMLLILLGIVWVMPNTAELTRYREYAGNKIIKFNNSMILKWRPSLIWSFTLSILTIICLIFISDTGEFLYFQF